MLKRIAYVPVTVALLASVLVLAPAAPAVATPVATDESTYQAYGRVFPDPHGCMPRTPPFSPYAKGNVCAADFIQFDEMVAGLGFLQQKFPGFIQLARLDEAYKNDDYLSAGLATADLGHAREPLWMVRVTDERVPDAGKKHFLFPLSIHGIERAGVEGGVRAIEDLATWGATEPSHPLLETSPGISVKAGEALRKSAVYFIFPNPDGWRRGDRDNGVFYQRYNGNGIDLNRDWPAQGFTFEPYTPFSEPESRAFGEVLRKIRPKWDGGIDLHGQLIDRAFSFTLLGQGQHDYAKNQAMLDVVQGAWADAEKRLAWSPLIKPNDAPADDQRVYGVQWGTVWDTIGYTVTGALGDWIGQPQGLDAMVPIDNEMSLSHLSNCGTGTCWLADVEQLHVDGNKSLIYSMINFSLRPEDNRFRFAGRVAYLDTGRVVSSANRPKVVSAVAGLEPQEDITAELTPANEWTHEFDVAGPARRVFNGGFKVTVRALNVGAVSPGATATVLVERKGKDDWEVVNSYFNQSATYLQAGQEVDVNEPEPGRWRVRVEDGDGGAVFRAEIDFTTGLAWANPGQVGYRVSNLRFFEDLNRYTPNPLEAVTADDVISGRVDLARFDSLVVADEMLPGYVEPPPTGPAQGPIVFEGSTAAQPTYPCGGGFATDPTPGCEAMFQWDVDGTKNNASMTVTLDWQETANDWDLYIERYTEHGGYWSEVGRSAGSSRPEVATILRPLPGKYRARAVNFASAEPFPQKLEVRFSNASTPRPSLGTRTAADLTAFASRLRGFAEAGGNLVLTDSALRLLSAMGVVERGAVHDFSAYAGFIAFTSDGSTVTYDTPLAKNVQRPGAAEGTGHRHQTYEPVPLGFAIQDPSGSRANTAPIWAIDQSVWEKRGGRTVGTSTGDQMTLGELRLGKGVVRVVGALLPTPTNRYLHPYGLANYAVTYSGYQVFQNAIDYEAPTRVLGTKRERPADLPATGTANAAWVTFGVALLAAAGGGWRWRTRAKRA